MNITLQRAGLIFVLLVFLFLVGSTFFINPIAIWDEAIYANNALEMAHHPNPFVLTLDGHPDLYNTKPPLGIWLMALSIKIFGENEFAVRLPSVLAFLALLIVLNRFSKKQFNSYEPGIFACLVLLGSKGLLLYHGVRSGDLDSLLLLSTTVFALQSFSLLLNNNIEQRNLKRELFKLGAILLAGFFIKSTAIFLLVPGLIICLILSRNRDRILTNRYIYLVPLLLIIIIFLYYLLMHYLHPGYNRQVFFSEYKRIYTDIMPWHRESAGWYLKNLLERFTPYIFLLLPASLLGFFSKDAITRRVVLFSVITSATFLLIISLVPDKLEWYDLPVYPLFAIVIGIGCYEGIRRISNFARNGNKFRVIVPCVFILLLSVPVICLWKTIITSKLFNDLEKEAYCIKKVKRQFPGQKNITVLMQVENPLHRLSLDFYRKASKVELTIKTVSSVSELNKGDTVLCSQQNKLDSLQTIFHTIKLSDLKYGKLVLIQ